MSTKEFLQPHMSPCMCHKNFYVPQYRKLNFSHPTNSYDWAITVPQTHHPPQSSRRQPSRSGCRGRWTAAGTSSNCGTPWETVGARPRAAAARESQLRQGRNSMLLPYTVKVNATQHTNCYRFLYIQHPKPGEALITLIELTLPSRWRPRCGCGDGRLRLHHWIRNDCIDWQTTGTTTLRHFVSQLTALDF